MALAVGSKDWDKRMLMKYSPTVSRGSVRLMLGISMDRKLPIFVRVISHAYVSTDTNLLRQIYLIPPKGIGLDPDILWYVQKPLYGLPESGVHWFKTYISHHHHHKLGMTSIEVDPCLLYRKDKDRNLDGMICLQFDDSMRAGS